MAEQIINIGTADNDGTGDTLREASRKSRDNDTELYSIKEAVANKQNSLATDGTGEKYPTVDAVNAGLDGKVDDAQVLTNVPAGAVFTDTIYNDADVLKDADALTAVTPTNKLITESDVENFGGGDMLKSVYDPTNKNTSAFAVDNFIGATVEKTTPINADRLNLWDSVSSTFKYLTLTNLKAFLKTYFDGLYATVAIAKTEYMLYACSDETTDLTLGDKISIRMPFAMTLSEVRITVNVAPTITKLIVDVKEAGVSIFSTLPSIDTAELSSVTAAIPAVISDVNLADDALLVVSITQLGSGDIGKGLKIAFKGTRI